MVFYDHRAHSILVAGPVEEFLSHVIERRIGDNGAETPGAKRMRCSLVLILCIGLSAPANAQQRGGYVGLSAGSYRFKDDDEEIGVSVSDKALSYGVFGGYRFSESFALEGSLGRTTDFENVIDALFFLDSQDAEYHVQTVRALGIVQLDQFGLFGGLGYHDSDLNAFARVNGTVIDLDASDSGTTAVVGVQFDGKSLSYRLQYEWFDASKRLDLSNVAFGLVIRF